MKQRIKSDTLSYERGFYYRLGNKVICTNIYPPRGIDFIPTSVQKIPEYETLYSWEIEGWAEYLEEEV